MRINLCIIDEGDARDKVTYQKSVERRNNIRCDWLVRTSNYTNCNQNHTLWKTLIIHEDWKKYNVFRVFVSSCHVIFETALFPLPHYISDWIYVPVLPSVWNFIFLKGYTRCCCFHDAEWSVIRRQRNVMRILRSPMLN